MMNGQLWEPCPICGTEPVCAACGYCRNCCICPPPPRARQDGRSVLDTLGHLPLPAMAV